MADLIDDNGDSVKAVLIDPNSAEITRYHDPYDIDDPFTYRAVKGFIGINLWTQDNSGTVYLQGHLVIPNDWGNVSTNGDTTTTTTDTTEKGGGDDVEPCGKDPWNPYKKCMYRCFSEGKDALENDKEPGGLGDFSRDHKNDNGYKDRFYHWKDAQRNYHTMVGCIGGTLSGVAITSLSTGIGIGIAVGIALGALGFMVAFMSHMGEGDLWIKGMDWPTVIKYWEKREKDCRDYCEYLMPERES